MADSFITLSQLTTINDRNAFDLGCTDLYDDAPMLKALSATVASNGNQHKYIKESAAPTVGFRAVNVGLANSNSTDTEVTVPLQILDGSFAADKAMADAYYKGAAEFIARESRRHLRAVMFAAEQQIINGVVGANSAGFTGLADALSALSNTAHVVNAGGTTATTGSSVYLIRTNDLGVDVQVVIGQNGNLVIGDTITQQLTDSSGGHYTGYWTPIQGWMALQVGSLASITRIANVTADSGHTLTDALISNAIATFPASRQPNMIVMGRRSLNQLQKSRTAVNITGAPAPIPQDSFGIPIICTDGVGAVEALIS